MMSFGTAIATCMGKYVTFSGRAPRAEYWWFTLFTSILAVVFELVHPTIALVVNLLFFLPLLSVSWRRMHDVGKHGAWIFSPLLGFFPLGIGVATHVTAISYIGVAIAVGLVIYVFILSITRGDVGENLYGPDPYGMGTDPSVFD